MVSTLNAQQISTRAPREGSDSAGKVLLEDVKHFNPRSPRGERPDDYSWTKIKGDISTRAPREGSDVVPRILYSLDARISTRAPREGSDTIWLRPSKVLLLISTRAPREGSD